MRPLLLLWMFLQILQEFWRFGPVLHAPIGKIPLVHVVIALEIHIVQRAVHGDEIGGEVINVGVCCVEAIAH